MPDPCSGHGACSNVGGAPVCACDTGYQGSDCSTCAFLVNQAASGAGTGASWMDAYTTIQPALAAAKTEAIANSVGCDVWVAEGTYYARVSNAHDTFAVASDVGFYGGFAGGETARNQADPTAHVTVLSGRTSAGNPASSLHVVGVFDATGVTIDGFTIRDGKALSGSNEDLHGGGIVFYGFNKTSTGTVSHCDINSNQAEYGGGIGTIWDPGAVSIVDTKVHDNTATVNAGGAELITKTGATAVVANTTFTRNVAAGTAGGVWSNTVLTMSDSTLAGNVATSGDGGALFLITHAGTSLTNVQFRENYAGSSGGAIRAAFPDGATLTSCLFVGNQSGDAGAIYDDTDAGLIFINTTVTENRGAPTNADGIVWNKGAPHFYNTIVWGNPTVSAAGVDIYESAAMGSIVTSHSDIGAFAGMDATTFDANPSFVALPAFFDRVATNGASTSQITVALPSSHKPGDAIEIGFDGVARTIQSVIGSNVNFQPPLANAAPLGTIVRNWGATLKTLDATLGVGSPCVDQADSMFAPANDIVNQPRIGTGPDIGAYESH
jgi:predicted outer membrane repeat protein